MMNGIKLDENTPLEIELANPNDDLNEQDLSNVNPRSFYRKIPLTKEQTKKRKASKQAKKSRKTNRRK